MAAIVPSANRVTKKVHIGGSEPEKCLDGLGKVCNATLTKLRNISFNARISTSRRSL